MEGLRTIVKPPPQRERCATLPKTRTESYGPPHPAVCGSSTLPTGSVSDLNQTYPPHPSVKRGLIKPGRRKTSTLRLLVQGSSGQFVAKTLRFVDSGGARILRLPHCGGYQHAHRSNRLSLPRY